MGARTTQILGQPSAHAAGLTRRSLRALKHDPEARQCSPRPLSGEGTKSKSVIDLDQGRAAISCIQMLLENGVRKTMTMKARLSELERRHHKLESEIADALARSSTDDLKIVELKRQKLHLKDEMERLRHERS